MDAIPQEVQRRRVEHDGRENAVQQLERTCAHDAPPRAHEPCIVIQVFDGVHGEAAAAAKVVPSLPK